MQAKDVKFQDALISYNLDLIKYSNGVSRDVIRMLDDLQVKVVRLLSSDTLTEIRKVELNGILREINTVTGEVYDNIASTAIGATIEIPDMSATLAAKELTAAFEGTITAALPASSVLDTLATNAMIQGAPQAAWWDKQSSDSVFRFQNAVRRGIIAGSANRNIIKEVKDEIGVSRRHAETLVRTSILTVSNDALLAGYKENADVLKGVEWVATLDSRTCPQCAPRDGLTWTLDKKAIGHRVAFRKPPRHFSCRCLLSPVTKTFKEMGIDLPELKPIDRSSVAGPVGGNMDFEAFLKRQGKEFQNETLGTGRADLWREGKITLLDLINSQGRVLTIKELKNRRS